MLTEPAVIYTQGGNPPVLLTHTTEDDCTQGGQWFFYWAKDPAPLLPTRIDLCPDTCAMVQAEFDVSIQIQFTCIGGEV
jgi:hypothetical protein